MVFLSWLFGGSKPAAESHGKTPTPAPAPPAQPAPPTPALLPASQREEAPPAHQQQHPETEHHPPIFSRRALRQLGLFLGGAGFLSWSILLSRRAIVRHQLAAQLKFFQPSHVFALPPSPSGRPPKRDPTVALEALSLATLNTASFAIMAAGGLAWAFNLSSLDDLTRRSRRSLQATIVGGRVDHQAERELAEYVAGVLGIEQQQQKPPPSSGEEAGER